MISAATMNTKEGNDQTIPKTLRPKDRQNIRKKEKKSRLNIERYRQVGRFSLTDACKSYIKGRRENVAHSLKTTSSSNIQFIPKPYPLEMPAPTNTNNAANKRPRPDKQFDPREEAKAVKKPRTPAGNKTSAIPTAKPPAPAQAQPQTDPTLTCSTTIRSDQELEAEAGQTQLDIGFVLALSENPTKALESAKNDLER